MPAEPVPVSMASLVANEARIVASAVGTRHDLQEVLDLAASGSLRCRIQERRLEEVNQVFDELRHGTATARVVLKI
jgi:propanol-preferring alcohol dehydrogenase